jgi:hypothetical protein
MGEEEDEWEDTQAVDIEESSLMDLIGIIWFGNAGEEEEINFGSSIWL